MLINFSRYCSTFNIHTSFSSSPVVSLFSPRSLLNLWLTPKITILTIPANGKHTHLISNLNKTTTLSINLLPVTLVLLITVLNYTIIPMTMIHMLIGTPILQNRTRAAIPVHKPTSTPMRWPKSLLPLQFLKCRTRDIHKVHILYNNHSSILHPQECIEMAPLAGLSLEKNS
jgi:hypothetical protein